MGQLDHGIHLVEDVADVARVQPSQTEKLAVVTQTTLSVDDAAGSPPPCGRDSSVREPKQQDICYATQNRQDAVKVLSPQVDVLVVAAPPAPTATACANWQRAWAPPPTWWTPTNCAPNG